MGMLGIGIRLLSATERKLYKAAASYGWKFSTNSKPTYWPTDFNKTPDLIEFFVVKLH